MMLLLFAALVGCKGSDVNDTPDTEETGTPIPETGRLAGVLNYPSEVPPGAKLHIAIKADITIWTEADYREAHENPTMPFSYDLAVPVGSYYLGAYLDLTNDSPGGPAAGDPSGAAHDETGPTQQVVTANQTTEVAPINLKVQEPGG